MDTATVSVVVSGAVALAGVGLAGWELHQRRTLAREDRQHQRQLAHDERTYVDRRDMYLELLRYASRMDMVAKRTGPWFGLKDMPPPPQSSMSDDERVELDARVQAFGSDQVHTALSLLEGRFQAFMAAHTMVAALEAQRVDAADLDPAKEERDRGRGEVFDALRALRRLVNVELAEV
jgi:hypothetical protein